MIYPPHRPHRNVPRYASTIVIVALCRVSLNHQPQSRRRYQERVIPPDEDIRRLFQECKIARGNADVLSQTLAFARPDALDAELIPVSSSIHHVRSLVNTSPQEFFAKCRASQELIYTQIPWASAGAERSRVEKIALQHTRRHSLTHGSPEPSVADTEGLPDELTTEEELLAALLDAHEALVAALGMHDDLARVAAERAAEEKSKREVKMDRRVSFIPCSFFSSVQAGSSN